MNEPIELIALDDPYSGAISARRAGEPSFTHVSGLGDAMMTALSRGCDLVIPEAMLAELGADSLPPDLPAWVQIRRSA
jgi:hypothetical protein